MKNKFLLSVASAFLFQVSCFADLAVGTDQYLRFFTPVGDSQIRVQDCPSSTAISNVLLFKDACEGGEFFTVGTENLVWWLLANTEQGSSVVDMRVDNQSALKPTEASVETLERIQNIISLIQSDKNILIGSKRLIPKFQREDVYTVELGGFSYEIFSEATGDVVHSWYYPVKSPSERVTIQGHFLGNDWVYNINGKAPIAASIYLHALLNFEKSSVVLDCGHEGTLEERIESCSAQNDLDSLHLVLVQASEDEPSIYYNTFHQTYWTGVLEGSTLQEAEEYCSSFFKSKGLDTVLGRLPKRKEYIAQTDASLETVKGYYWTSDLKEAIYPYGRRAYPVYTYPEESHQDFVLAPTVKNNFRCIAE
ncbi:MAG: hypothetical protein H6620_07350 [Halobacteriovoraceae bacterium]|nr:hypothetical protein [Halobacteriovoraceae bacterium]